MSNYTQEDLQKAGIEMKLASMDYDDNIGSSDSGTFWRYFEEKRRNYIRIKNSILKSS